jgi:predicted  nucleic acid-binding Zn-ribbon protein
LQKTLQFLIELQEIEKRVQALDEQKARAPKQIAALNEGKNEVEAQLSEKQEMLESVRKSRRQLEMEVEDLQARKASSKQKLLGVKSNKEYQATLKEIDDIEELVRGHEDQIIEQMESTERLKRQIQEQEQLLAEARQRLKQEGAQLEKDAEKADKLIVTLEGQKEQLKPQIPADLLKRYYFLRANRAGIALAPVNKGTCQVCHMNLPPQIFNDLQKNQTMLHCPNCQRIIYWVGHEAYQMSSKVLGEQG